MVTTTTASYDGTSAEAGLSYSVRWVTAAARHFTCCSRYSLCELMNAYSSIRKEASKGYFAALGDLGFMICEGNSTSTNLAGQTLGSPGRSISHRCNAIVT